MDGSLNSTSSTFGVKDIPILVVESGKENIAILALDNNDFISWKNGLRILTSKKRKNWSIVVEE